jgi:hypothetical protein
VIWYLVGVMVGLTATWQWMAFTYGRLAARVEVLERTVHDLITQHNGGGGR